MRRLFFQMMVSADGLVSGPDGELDWHVIDDDFSRYVDHMLRSIDTIVMGRVTYEALASYWPDATLPEAPLMNALPKVVCSRTLDRAEWGPASIARDAEREVRRLKQLPGRDLALFGSPTLAASLAEAGLIDEYRLLVCPVVLGAGRPMFPGLRRRFALSLVHRETFASGVTRLDYVPAS